MSFNNKLTDFIKKFGTEVTYRTNSKTTAILQPIIKQSTQSTRATYKRDITRIGQAPKNNTSHDNAKYYTYIGLALNSPLVQDETLIIDNKSYKVENYELIETGDKLKYSKAIIKSV